MSLSPELIQILCCPESLQPVALASPDLVARLNGRVARGELKNRAGQPVSTPLEAGLLRADGTILYPVRNQLPIMLIEEGIPV